MSNFLNDILDGIIENPLVKPILSWGEKKKAYLIQQGVKSALPLDANGKLETAASLSVENANLSIGDIDLTGVSLDILSSTDSSKGLCKSIYNGVYAALQNGSSTVANWINQMQGNIGGITNGMLPVITNAVFKYLPKISDNSDKLTYDSDNNLKTTFNRMPCGDVVTAHSEITATNTSIEIDCSGFNSVRIEVETTNVSSTDKIWTPIITGSCTSGSTFGQIFQNVAGSQVPLVLPAIAFGDGNIKQTYVIQGGITNFLKITETLSGTNGTSTITVKATPFNV